MCRILMVCVFSLATGIAFSQYVPNNGQAYQFASLYNPAFIGVENFTDLKLSYRYQWSGFGGNAPKFMNLALNARLKQPLDLRSNTMRMSKPSIVQADKLPKRKRIIHGLGFNVFQSHVGAIKSIGGAFGFAWNYPLSKKTRLALGASSVLESRKIQLEGLTFNQPDPFYEHLLNSSASQLDVSLRAGFLLYSKGFYFGASYIPIVNQSLEASELAFEEPFYIASFHSGFSMNLSKEVAVKPSVLAYLQADNEISIDYNLKTYFQDKAMVGITYRDNESGIFMLGFNASNFLTVTYSYETSFGEFKQFSDSSHELVLGLRINNLRKMPYYAW